MAQTRRRRRKKHRGTQGGSIDRRPSGPRPRSRAEARARAKSQIRGGAKKKPRRTVDRRDVAPTWRSAVNRALIGAGIFLVLLLLPFHQKPSAAIPLAVLMLVLYIPLGYTIEKFFYARRQARKAQAAAGKSAK
jgi:hypothetical protein